MVTKSAAAGYKIESGAPRHTKGGGPQGVQGIRKEISTLPVGPNEEGSWFWAQSRLAYSTMGIHVWTPWYPVAILSDLIARLDLEGFERITIWSDTGIHFRCVVQQEGVSACAFCILTPNPKLAHKAIIIDPKTQP